MNKKEIINIISKARKDIESAPEGALKAVVNNNLVQYYYRLHSTDKTGIYLGKKDIGKAKMLAQKEYASKVLKESERQLKAYDRFIKSFNPYYVEKVWKKFNPLKKQLVVPYTLTDEEFKAQWRTGRYEGCKEPFDKNYEYYTKTGIRVRSKTELMIANLLDADGIPYRYEYPHPITLLDTYRNPYMIDVHPDFTILNIRTRKEYIWEHFGMMDYESYRRGFFRKMKDYNMNGYFVGENMIATYSDNTFTPDRNQLERIISRYLK